MEDRKCIWLLNHHANHGLRHHELAKEFTKYGYIVVIVASSYTKEAGYRYEDDCHIEPLQEGIVFVWLHTKPAYSGNGVGRVRNMLSYVAMVKKHAPSIWDQFGKPTCVVGSSVHPFAWEAAWWVSKRCKAKFICEVRDLWPLSLIELLGVSPANPAVKLFGLIEKRAYFCSDAIVTTMPFAYRYICDELGYSKEKVNWIPNGIHLDEASEDISLPDDLDSFLTSHWCCIYTGSLVKSECVDYMLDAFELLDDTDIWFAIIGDGTEREEIESRISQQNMDHVKLFPRMDKRKVVPALKKAKVCLAAHHDLSIYRYGLSMNKLNDYLLSGIPVVFACGMPNVIEETKNISIPYGEAKDMAKAIKRIKALPDEEYLEMAVDGQRIIREQYDYELLARKYLDIIEQARSVID